MQRTSDESLFSSRLIVSRSPVMAAQNISQTSVPTPGDHIKGSFFFSASGRIMRWTFSADFGSREGLEFGRFWFMVLAGYLATERREHAEVGTHFLADYSAV